MAVIAAAMMVLIAWESAVVAFDPWDELLASMNASAAWFIVAVGVGCGHSALHLAWIALTGKPTMTEKVATESLAKYGNHLTMIAHREGDGTAEFHAKQADVFFVQSGEATLIVGGDVVDSKTTAPDEIRGPSIRNGSKKTLHAGDLISTGCPKGARIKRGDRVQARIDGVGKLSATVR